MFAVAPHAGAWIETGLTIIPAKLFLVAPHAGAWIETRRGQILGIRQGSRLMRARGLKPWDDEKQELGHWVAPHAGAWIETVG